MNAGGAWPYPEMWWVLCGAHELDVTLFGPFATRERAESDAAAAECEHAHFAVMGTPPLPPKVPLLPSVLGDITYPEVNAMADWLAENVGTRRDCIKPADEMSERWLNAPHLAPALEPF